MRDIEEIWEETVAQTLDSAANDVSVDFSTLKNTRDALRETACQKLLEIFRLIGENFAEKGLKISLQHAPTHRFDVQMTSMVGQKLVLSCGIRSLTIEAGYPRTGTDGFMRGNSLAAARISHFGVAQANQLLYLHQLDESEPTWFTSESEFSRKAFEAADVRRHFGILLETENL